ncbi:hypothetical protein COLO4_38193 [Corchorus olitorius]|uniref:Uncharacterized protein n=1 Tax=Corchorus olitorius TaxID=93759 RepID=A0A1R3FWI4_9ROSI|nr:hypothetical protein COLO4_38193 [Corchorus olitorius]
MGYRFSTRSISTDENRLTDFLLWAEMGDKIQLESKFN